MYGSRPARPEHIEAVVKVLSDGKLHSLKWITQMSGLTLTAAKGAVAHLEKNNKLKAVRQAESPKLRVALRTIPR